MSFEYLRIDLDFGDLTDLNSFGSSGWRVVTVVPSGANQHRFWALLERPLPTQSETTRQPSTETTEAWQAIEWVNLAKRS